MRSVGGAVNCQELDAVQDEDGAAERCISSATVTRSDDTVLWRRLDRPGHDAARVVFHEPFWQLGGMAVFSHEGLPCRLEYSVVCDAAWRTLHAGVVGWMGSRPVRVNLVASAGRGWHLNGGLHAELADCVDVDLAFTPATNMLPIRRLALRPGQAATVRAAWLTFPDLTLEPLDQSYRRIGETSYRYESRGGAFATDLEVNSAGFVIRYPGLWQQEP
jgi:hypothetical protein